MNTLLDVIPDTKSAGSDSYNAPHCPECGKGDDRLVIFPESGDTGFVWCRRCGYGRRDSPGGAIDGIQYLRDVEGYTFAEACDFFGVDRGDSSTTSRPAKPKKPTRPPLDDTKDTKDKKDTKDTGHTLTKDEPDEDEPGWKDYTPPPDLWQERALIFCEACKRTLRADTAAAKSARSYLYGRGLSDDTIEEAGLGLNLRDQYPTKQSWGLEGDGKVWLPRGITIPWGDGERVIGVNIRRPEGDVEPGGDPWEQRKYQRASGAGSPLYGVMWTDNRPVVLVEGEFDALAITQTAGDLVDALATGSTGGARRRQWLDLLRDAPAVLVAFDSEEAGETAAREWLHVLPNATRWHPHGKDTAEMLETGQDVRMWVRFGLQTV